MYSMHAHVHIASPALVNPIQCHEITRVLRAPAMSLHPALWTMHNLYGCMGRRGKGYCQKYSVRVEYIHNVYSKISWGSMPPDLP